MTAELFNQPDTGPSFSELAQQVAELETAIKEAVELADQVADHRAEAYGDESLKYDNWTHETLEQISATAEELNETLTALAYYDQVEADNPDLIGAKETAEQLRQQLDEARDRARDQSADMQYRDPDTVDDGAALAEAVELAGDLVDIVDVLAAEADALEDDINEAVDLVEELDDDDQETEAGACLNTENVV